jgi:hypothetical protein
MLPKPSDQGIRGPEGWVNLQGDLVYAVEPMEVFVRAEHGKLTTLYVHLEQADVVYLVVAHELRYRSGMWSRWEAM